METEPEKGKVENTQRAEVENEKEKPNKTKRKANLKLVWLWVSWRGRRAGGTKKGNKARAARCHFYSIFMVLFHANKLFNSTV